MKPKVIYLSLSVLLIIILLSILIGRVNERKPGNLQPIITQQEAVTQPQNIATPTAQPAALAENMPAITIIKNPAKEKTAKAQEMPEEVVKRFPPASQPPQSTVSQSQSSNAASWAEPDEMAKPRTGITEIGKHPSAKENKEMNARGVIIY